MQGLLITFRVAFGVHLSKHMRKSLLKLYIIMMALQTTMSLVMHELLMIPRSQDKTRGKCEIEIDVDKGDFSAKY